ncbi:tetratricopeptide repeat protein [Streptomyces goshikiensis]|uniref:transcriptional regulator n=1 Tax=Streptomyces TaxID=1883 RepID=UPI000C277099|nr:transcriptional regulator [Streptomyces sp. CB02120-2]PJN14637.1 transcriptional regulator [Streptomyces sp. CB02120-2]
MATRERTPNEALTRLFTETEWTNGAFIRAVSRVARERGHEFGYDESSVRHWMTGTLPRPAVRPLILEALSRRLGRPITAHEAGFAAAPDLTATPADTLAGLMDLGRADMDPSRRTVIRGIVYSAALAVPGWQEIDERLSRLDADPHARIGMAEVDTVIAMTERISTLDDEYGGRTARPMAAAFLVNTIIPHLKAQASEPVRKAMLSAAADHLYLTGYMAMDERADGLAQRYYVKALDLAHRAGDHLTYCTTLRGMSVQAVDLGHTRQAVRLAESASSASPQAGPRMLAFLAGQQAHAAAQDGDRPAALAHIKTAETAMDRAESRAKALGSYNPSALAYHVGQVRFELGDITGSIGSMELADRLREPTHRRTRVRYNAMLAERQWQAGRMEEAVATWGKVLDDYPHVQSGRCDDRVRTLISTVAPRTTNPLARDLHDRAKTLLQR